MKAMITSIDEEFIKGRGSDRTQRKRRAKKALEWKGMKVRVDRYESHPEYSQTLSEKELKQGYKVGIASDRSMGRRGGAHMIKIGPAGKMTKISSTWD
jgi:hypothetical protein